MIYKTPHQGQSQKMFKRNLHIQGRGQKTKYEKIFCSMNISQSKKYVFEDWFIKYHMDLIQQYRFRPVRISWDIKNW